MVNISQKMYQKIKATMDGWHADDIYAISFFVYSNECQEYRGYANVPMFAISYNTESHCDGAGPVDEERWNYAFWPQDETFIIDPSQPNELTDMLFDWYAQNGIDNVGYDDGDCDGKGPVGHYELLCLATDIAIKLRNEGYVEKRFGKSIPILLHGLEYAWFDFEATKKANPNGEAKDFFDCMAY